MNKIVGIFSDGSEIKIAIFEKRNKDYFLIDLIAHGGTEHNGYSNGDSSKEKIVLDDSIPVVLDSETTNSENGHKINLKQSLVKYDLKDLVFIPVVTEPIISYNLFAESKKLDKKSFNKRLTDQWKQYQKTKPEIDKIKYVQYPDNTVLSIYNNEYFPVLTQLENLAESSKFKNLHIPQVITADILLADYVIKKFPLVKEDIYLIVYVGYESSRLIFIAEKKIKYISGYLSFGSQTMDLDSVLSSKIFLESENAQVSKINKAFLCGEILNENIVENIKNNEEFEEIEVLNLEKINTDSLREELRDKVPGFIIPLLAVINYIQPLNNLHLKLNLLPNKLIESQKVFKIGFTGTILLILIFIEVLLFTYAVMDNNQTLENRKIQLQNLRVMIQENRKIQDSIKLYEEKIASVDKVFANLDTLVQGAEKWTEFLIKLHDFNLNNKKIWINSFNSDNVTNTIVASGIIRNQIPNFADYLDYSILKNITVMSIRDKPVNKFELNFDPSKYGLKGLKQ